VIGFVASEKRHGPGHIDLRWLQLIGMVHNFFAHIWCHPVVLLVDGRTSSIRTGIGGLWTPSAGEPLVGFR
jgi:hypothetical protein